MQVQGIKINRAFRKGLSAQGEKETISLSHFYNFCYRLDSTEFYLA